jgi:hypothetical protein
VFALGFSNLRSIGEESLIHARGLDLQAWNVGRMRALPWRSINSFFVERMGIERSIAQEVGGTWEDPFAPYPFDEEIENAAGLYSPSTSSAAGSTMMALGGS